MQKILKGFWAEFSVIITLPIDLFRPGSYINEEEMKVGETEAHLYPTPVTRAG